MLRSRSPAAPTDATTDHASSDGAARDAASPVESSTDAPAEGSTADAGGSDG